MNKYTESYSTEMLFIPCTLKTYTVNTFRRVRTLAILILTQDLLSPARHLVGIRGWESLKVFFPELFDAVTSTADVVSRDYDHLLPNERHRRFIIA